MIQVAEIVVDLRAWHPEFHTSGDHLQAEELERPSWDCRDLAGVDSKADRVEWIDCDPRVANRLGFAVCHEDDVVDVHDITDAEPT